MKIISRSSRVLLMAAMLSTAAAGSLSAQEEAAPNGEILTTVYGSAPADLTGMTEGPEIEGFISARKDDRMQVTSADGTSTVVVLSQGTEIKSKGGFLGLNRDTLAADSLLNGLPVTVETVQWGSGLVASRIDLKSKDLQTAAMIRNGTAQGFAEQTAATEALRGRVGDIDQYNVKYTTNVNFDVGKAALSSWRF